MRSVVVLDESTYLLYAVKHYTPASSCSITDFCEDIARIKHINRLIRRYARTSVLAERLILNHLVALYNVFESEHLTRMLVYKLRMFLDILKPFLEYLQFWPRTIEGIGVFNETIDGSSIVSDKLVATTLKEL